MRRAKGKSASMLPPFFFPALLNRCNLLTMKTMARGLRWFAYFLLLLTLASTASAQGGLLKNLTPSLPTTGGDSLNRTSPRNTVIGFMDAVQKNDVSRALGYLELSKQARDVDGGKLVRDLQLLFDRAYVGHVNEISDSPTPTGSSPYGATTELGGSFIVSGKQTPLVLVRVKDANVGEIWLIGWSETLSHVAETADNVSAHDFEGRLPSVLVNTQIFNIALWIWIWAAIMLGPAWVVGKFIASLAALPLYILKAMHKAGKAVETWAAIRKPISYVLAGFTHAAALAIVRSGLPLLVRLYYYMLLRTLIIACAAWVCWNLVSLAMAHARARMLASGEHATLSMFGLAQKLTNLCILLAAVMAVLANLGFNLTTALAGLGIGGIAVALAAQKSLENLFGGVSVLSDQTVRVGDTCKIGDKTGVIEDIGIRSTRLRTLERASIAIPNGALATMSVENLTLRDKLLFNPKLGLVYATSAAQMQAILAELRSLMTSDARIEQGTHWVRFTTLADSALVIELYAYVQTKDWQKFLETREELLLAIMKIVERNGSSFAYPTQTVIVEKAE